MIGRMLSRRGFMAVTAAHAGAAAITTVAAGSLVFAAGGEAWAYALKALNDEQAQALLGTARVLFPHDRFGEETYAAVVAVLDADAAADPAVREVLAEGVAELDRRSGGRWNETDRDAQASVLKELEGTAFFTTVHFKSVATIYTRPEVWQALGYEGPSYPEGGYLHRGFNDLGWLPNPPPEASGPVEA